MKSYRFFDSAATTRCSPAAAAAVETYLCEAYGNPSSNHALGYAAARAIRNAKSYFGQIFGVPPEQVIFCGSGTEADNLAIQGVAQARLAIELRTNSVRSQRPRVLYSSIEHPAVARTARSLEDLGFEVHAIPVTREAQIDLARLEELLTPNTFLVSIMSLNNIVGAILPAEDLATWIKKRCPNVIFHTDCVQAFGKITLPRTPSSVDLISISAHKIGGPKGIGALIVINPDLIRAHRLRPLIWGGAQESGFRSGTQNAGLIAGFHIAAQETLQNTSRFMEQMLALRNLFIDELGKQNLTNSIHLNSPADGAPHILNLSVPGLPAGPLAKLLEERGCLVSTGSACSSNKPEPDPILVAMKLPENIVSSALRISFAEDLLPEDVVYLVRALAESISIMRQLIR